LTKFEKASPSADGVLEVRYATRGDHHLAYTVTGEGPLELVYMLGFVSHLDLLWDEPRAAAFFARLGRVCRLIVMDKRGTGLSDRTGDVPIPEEQVDDLLAVMDTVGFERPAVLGTQDSFLVAALLAASRPERVSALIAVAAGAHAPADYGPPDAQDRFFAGLEKYWGRTDAPFNYWAPRLWREDASFRRWWARYSRAAAGPTSGVRIVRNYVNTDLRPILGAIRVPTLVIQGRTDELHKRLGRALADGIPKGRFVTLPTDTINFPWLDAADALSAHIEEFLTGSPAEPAHSRVLATVLVTDVDRSTEQVANMGDRRWSALLDRHDGIIRHHVERYRGRLVKHTGDGVLSTFDGPGRALSCALAAREALHAEGISIRAGAHTGEIEVRGDDVAGLAVHIAARVVATAGTGELLVSSTVRDLVVGSEFVFEDRGECELKGVPGRWRLSVVLGMSQDPADSHRDV
jgi:class 3 adenylate cyclase